MKNVEAASIHRILDANANRAGEGLRTLEETSRFILNDPNLTDRLKSHRHDLATAMRCWPRQPLLRARDTPGDVGTQIKTPAEMSRIDLASIVAAAATRTQQALRCLEEYGKLEQHDSAMSSFAGQIESIRYRCYDTFRDLELRLFDPLGRRQHIRDARLYALIECEATEDALNERIRALADAKVDVIQLRDRAVDDRTLFTQATCGASFAKQVGVLWIINDRPDIAVASDADGVHVGQEELPVDAVRKIVGPDRLIGLSTHNMNQVCAAGDTSADYIGCGPTFPGKTKTFNHFPGCDLLKQVAAATDAGTLRLPAFAIGGIDVANVSDVAAAGIGRIAVTGALAKRVDLKQRATNLRTRLETVPIACEVTT